jgi:hypothetical protein
MPCRSNQKRLSVIAMIAPVFALSMIPTFQPLWSQTSPNAGNKLGVYTSDAKPYGLTYGQWTAKWWTWLISIPSSNSPATDSSGADCAQKQSGPVWFLAGSTTGKAERTCIIPGGKAMLFAIIDAECSYAEFPNIKTVSDLRNCAVSQENQVTHLETTVDGVSLKNSQMPRVQSPLFDFTFPANNIFGAPTGPSQSVADGYYVFLQPLSPGKHDISFKGSSVQFTTTGTNTVAQDIIYHIGVQ